MAINPRESIFFRGSEPSPAAYVSSAMPGDLGLAKRRLDKLGLSHTDKNLASQLETIYAERDHLQDIKNGYGS